jgi:GTP1/Obg family GTP-binding protein
LPLGKTLAGSTLFYLFFPVLLVLFIALVWLRRKQIRENADLALVRNRKASKIAKKRLKSAEKHMHANQKGPFYDELLNAIYGYLSDKLRISLSELSLEKATEQLQLKGLNESLIKSIGELIDRCQYARYAPSSEQGSINDDYESAAEIIGKLEQNLR